MITLCALSSLWDSDYSLSCGHPFCRHLKEHGYDPGSAAFQEVSLDSEESHNSSVVVGKCAQYSLAKAAAPIASCCLPRLIALKESMVVANSQSCVIVALCHHCIV